MHPIAGILGFVIGAAYLTLGNVVVIALVTGVVAIAHLARGGADLHGVYRLLWRLRWIFISILIVYLATTPGAPLIPGMPVPSVEGASAALQRVSTLAVMVFMLVWLMGNVAPAAQIGAIYRLARCIPAFPAERLAVRSVLVMESLLAVQELLRAHRWPQEVSVRDPRALGGALATLCAVLIEGGEQRPAGAVEVAEVGMPPAGEWGILVGVSVLLAVAQLAL